METKSIQNASRIANLRKWALDARHTGHGIHPEYTRKLAVAAQMADAAWLRGGLDGMDAAVKGLRMADADQTIISEFERLYRKQMVRTLPYSF